MNLNKLMILALPLMIGCIIVGCGGSPSESDLIGKWESDLNITKQAMKDEGLEGEELKMGLMMISSMSIILEFRDDGSVQSSVSGFGESETNEGEWKLDGSTLKIRYKDEEWEQGKISLNGDEFVMKQGEQVFGMKRVK